MSTQLFLRIALVFGMAAALGFAQQTAPDFAGPGVLSEGTGEAGSRGGKAVDLRLYAGINGIYETGLQPFGTDARGNLLRVQPLWGVEARLGAYGVHRWKRAQLGVDYSGGYRHYAENSYFDGSDHNLSLGYTFQQSRRITWKFQEAAGTYGRTFGNSFVGPDGLGLSPAGQFLDTRTTFLRSSGEIVILQSARTFYTVEAAGYLSDRRAKDLADIKGYNLNGSVGRRITQYQSVGATYSFGQQDVPFFSTDVTTHSFEGTYDAQIGALWSLSVRGGAFISEVQSVNVITLDPILAAIFGTNKLALQSNRKNTFPSGSVTLRRQFKEAALTANYSRSIGVGNGLIAAARMENGTIGYSYSGVRKWNFGVSGGYYSMRDLVKSLGGSAVYSAGAGITYDLGHALHLNLRYDARHVDVDAGGNIRRDASRTTFGLLFSPGEFPLSLW